MCRRRLASLKRLPRRMPKVELDDELPLLLGIKAGCEECRILPPESISVSLDLLPQLESCTVKNFSNIQTFSSEFLDLDV